MVVLDPVPAPIYVDVCDYLALFRTGDELDRLATLFAQCVISRFDQAHDGPADREQRYNGSHNDVYRECDRST